MKLSIYSSFETGGLARVVDFWNDSVRLFSTIEFHGEGLLSWGATAPVSPDELRVLILDPAGLRAVVDDGLPAVLRADSPGRAPLLVLLPDELGMPDVASLQGARAELVDVLSAANTAGVREWIDVESRQIAGVPYTDLALAVVGTAVMRCAFALISPSFKVLALDCDGTLWQGLCAERGPHGITVAPEERALHDYLLRQKRAGRLLVLVSKNVPEDVEAVFRERTDLGLRRSDFAAVRIGWGDKSAALRELAQELNVALESFLLLDDSPVECAEVRAACGEVGVLLRPPAGVLGFLEATWPLDPRPRTDGELGETRTRLYQDEALRRTARRDAPSFADYIRSLEVRTNVRPATPQESARLFELAQRTNQFHTAGDRPSARTVDDSLAAGALLAISVADRFGDYGISGAVFLEREGDTLRVLRWLLSCRTLGRGVEEDVFDALVAIARREGFSTLEVRFTATSRNLPTQRFLEALVGRLGAGRGEGGDGPLGLRFTVVGLSACPRPLVLPAITDEGSPRMATSQAPDWTTLAELTRNVAALSQTLRLSSAAAVGPAITPDEQGVLSLVAEVLGRAVSRSDNLYALGADSLCIVRLLARLKSRMGMEVPIGEIMHRADVADLLQFARGPRPQSLSPDEGFLSQVQSLYDDDLQPP